MSTTAATTTYAANTILSEAKAMRRRNGKAELEVVPDLATFVASEVEYGEYDDY